MQTSNTCKTPKRTTSENPNCIQIVGGDFNHHLWSNTSHPITDIFLTKLQLVNAAYDKETIKSLPTPQIITFHKTSNWIDHFLYTGKAAVTGYKTYPDDPICTYTDHIPYSNDFRIYVPTDHYNIPNNINSNAAKYMKATHIQKHDKLAIEKYEKLCMTNFTTLHPDTTNWTIQDYTNYYENTCTTLVKLAKQATKYTINNSRPTFTAWSPSISFLYKYIQLLLKIRTKSKQNKITTFHHIHQAYIQILQFLCKAYFATKTKDNITTYRYRTAIQQIHPEYPQTIPLMITSKDELTQYIDEHINKCKHLTHAKHQKELRAKINDITKKHEENRQKGKIKKVVQWILEKETPRRFTTAVTTKNVIHALPQNAHNATLEHFTNHFTAHSWITMSHLNDSTPEGENLRTCLLKRNMATRVPLPCTHNPPTIPVSETTVTKSGKTRC